jgi:rod shape determining protein RodA
VSPSLRIDRRLVSNFDWVILCLVLLLTLVGIMTIFSATRPLPGEEHPNFYIRQMYWAVAGLVALVMTVGLDYRRLRRAAYPLLGVGLALLVAVLLAGRTGMGAQRWLRLGPVSFQPSEFFKLLYLVGLARYMSTVRGPLRFKQLLFAFLFFVLPPVGLVIKQPDLGSALVLLFLFVAMALGKGVHRKVLVVVIAFSLISVPFMGTLAWDSLKDYQKKRIMAFIQPDLDPSGTGYHIAQSKVAVGSGKVLGKGYMKGTQGPFRFLPEKHTDFIFAVFAEEWGFVGSILLLLVYLMLILRGLTIAEMAEEEFGRLLALGITAMFALYWFVNIGMTMGLAPVVGLPLPFMSYGGTALVSNFMAVGILINIRAHRFEVLKFH